MKRCTVGLIVLMMCGLLTTPLLAEAQQAGKMPRIGYLTHRTGPTVADAAFFQGLRELGWIEGQNLAIEYRWLGRKLERLPALAAELVRLKVDLIVVRPSFVALAVKKATATIPIVMQLGADAVENGLVVSLARPGGNVTGMSERNTDLYTKLLELLHATVPQVTQVTFLGAPRPGHKRASARLQEVAPTLGLTIQSFEVRRPAELASLLDAIGQDHPGALIVPGSLFTPYGQPIADFAATNRIPLFSVGAHSRMEESFLLLVYAPEWSDMARQAATYVDKILRGAKPGDLPVGRPTKFNLGVNLKAAKVLGITIPPIILYQATKVIQ